MKNILITGGAGYIGSVLTEKLLKENYNVTVVDNLFYSQLPLFHCYQYENFNFIKQDLIFNKLDKNFIHKFDIIIPLAAIVGAPICDKYPSMASQLNFDCIIDILEFKKKETLLIFPTTNSGYGVSKNDEFCNENSPLHPVSHYAVLKVDLEKKVLQSENCISLRLATVFGVSHRMRLDLLVNDFVYQAHYFKSLSLYEENFRRNFIHVNDVADTFSFCIKNQGQMTNEVFNVGLSEANLTKRQLAEKIQEFVPDLKINHIKGVNDPDKRDYLVSNKKIESKGWRANKSLEFGIVQLLNCFKSLKKNPFTNI